MFVESPGMPFRDCYSAEEEVTEALEGESFLVLAALVSITSLTGSGLLAIALWHLLLTPDEVWDAAHVDENHNMRLWGADAEATLRLQKRRREFDAAVQVLDYLRA
jgi:chaperone required for assembly of F1-ATPase